MKINSFYLFVILTIAAVVCFKFTVPENSKNSNAVILCEQFASPTFPPTGWVISGPGFSFWSRVTQSGFGVGTGSAKYDCWNAANGVTGIMTTHIFDPTTTDDKIVMDIAYPDAGFRDSLFLYTSTDGGISFVLLIKLGVDSLRSYICQGCNPSPFVPTASQWKKHEYGPLPIGTNKIQIVGRSSFGDNIYIDSVCIKAGIIGIGHNSNELPSVYSLSQNYPNPFNPSTLIKYYISKQSNVNLSIFDALGRLVKSFNETSVKPGFHTINFSGEDFSSGVYFYKIQAGDFTDFKKMVLLK